MSLSLRSPLVSDDVPLELAEDPPPMTSHSSLAFLSNMKCESSALLIFEIVFSLFLVDE